MFKKRTNIQLIKSLCFFLLFLFAFFEGFGQANLANQEDSPFPNKKRIEYPTKNTKTALVRQVPKLISAPNQIVLQQPQKKTSTAFLFADTDGDGIDDDTDTDDDNDGILDTNEQISIAQQNASAVYSSNSVSSPNNAIGSDNSRAIMNNTSDWIIIELNATYNVPSGKTITIEARDTESRNIMKMEQSTNGTTFTNVQTYDFPSKNTDYNPTYVLSGEAKYIRLSFSSRKNKNIEIDNVVVPQFYADKDTDTDGTLDRIDTDSDGDGCPDAIEGNGGYSKYDLDSNDRLVGGIDGNGVPSVTSGGQAIGSATNSGTQATLCNTGDAILTQIYQNGSDGKAYEITNISNTYSIPANAIRIGLYKNNASTANAPTKTFTLNSELLAGQSLVVRTGTLTGVTIINSPTTKTGGGGTTGIGGGNDILVLSKTTDNTAYTHRYDELKDITNKTSLVRSDLISSANKNYTASEWIVFIDDAKNQYANPPKRHPNDPLLSEVKSPSTSSNAGLGYHKINPTIYTTSWSNGNPDRSRTVVVSGNLAQSTKLSAKTLEITGSNQLTITNNLLVVTDGITINATALLKLAGTAQLVQTHTGAKNVSGSGNLYIDQNAELSSLYRFLYMSSPVITPGAANYSLNSVFKDGTTPTSSSSTVATPKTINYISGYDGNHDSSPIALAEYWIYTYDDEGSGFDYNQKGKNGTINPGKGFMFKGPGRAQNYTFTGTPNDGDYTYSSIPDDESILIGNPYPSALSATKFLRDNSDITGTLYLWQQAAEKNTTGGNSNSGHYESGYIGEYATINIGTSAAAVGPTSFQYSLTKTDAVVGGAAIKNDSIIKLTTANDSITFNNIGLSQSVDTLKLIYKSSKVKTFDIYVNGAIKKIAYSFPISNNDTLVIPDVTLDKTDTLLLKAKDSFSMSFWKGYLDIHLTYTAPPSDFIAVGQGFFITTEAEGDLVFNNSQREYVPEGTRDSFFFKSAKSSNGSDDDDDGYDETDDDVDLDTIQNVALPVLKLGMDYSNGKNQKYHRQIAVSFKSGNSFDYQIGYDSELFDKGDTDMYWKFPNQTQEFVIAGVQEFDLSIELPLEIVIENEQQVKISVDLVENLTHDIFLKDKLTSTTYKITDSPINLELSAGTYTDRFVITFAGKALATEDLILDKTNIYFDANMRQIVIDNYEAHQIQKVVLYNILGKQIKVWSNLSNQQQKRLQIPYLPTSLYIVKMTTEKGSVSKKIIIH